jgi:hypothetical protein
LGGGEGWGYRGEFFFSFSSVLFFYSLIFSGIDVTHVPLSSGLWKLMLTFIGARPCATSPSIGLRSSVVHDAREYCTEFAMESQDT